MDEFDKLIDEFKNKSSETINAVRKALQDEIVKAIRGEKTIPFRLPERGYSQTFYLIYGENDYEKNWPSEVKWKQYSKIFGEVYELLYSELFKQIEEGYYSLKVSVSDDEARKKWIINNLSKVIHNKVFKIQSNRPPLFHKENIKSKFIEKLRASTDPLSEYLKEKLSDTIKNRITVGEQRIDRNFLAELNEIIQNDTDLFQEDRFKNIELSEKTRNLLNKKSLRKNERVWLNIFLLEDAYPNEIIISQKNKQITEISLDDKPKNTDGKEYNPLEKELAYHEDTDAIIDKEYVDDINEAEDFTEDKHKFILQKFLQKAAFFWKPGELLDGKVLNANKGIYIAFFYSWLRKRDSINHLSLQRDEDDITYKSNTKDIDIAIEIGVHSAQIPKWKPHIDLERPFSISRTLLIFPVYFSEDSRHSIGMYDPTIRCYRKNDYDDNGAYAPIKKRKEILWSVYDFLTDVSQPSFLKSAYDRNFDDLLKEKAYPFSIRIMSNDEIGLHPKKHYMLVYISSVELDKP